MQEYSPKGHELNLGGRRQMCDVKTKLGIQIDDRKSTPAKMITKRDPALSEDANCLITKALPNVPIKILSE